MSEAIKARFLGEPVGRPGHEFVNGVPARNITEAEWDALPAEARTAARHTRQANGKPLYEIRTEAEMHPTAAVAKAEDAKPAAKPSGKGGD